MRLSLVCILAITVLVSLLPNVDGLVCECSCCKGPACKTQVIGRPIVASCGDCLMALCKSAFPNDCVQANGVIDEKCDEDSANTAASQYKSLSLGVLMASLSIYVHSSINNA